jgi:hypothetical protein
MQYGENNVATLKINLMASVYDTHQQNQEARTVCALWLVSGQMFYNVHKIQSSRTTFVWIMQSTKLHTHS